MPTTLQAHRRPLLNAAFALCALTLLVHAGPAHAAVGPVITSVTYSPNPLPVTGGQVTVTAQVTDTTSPLSSVTLLESRPGYNNTYRSAPMSVGGDGVTYTATIPVDFNTNNSANGESLAISAQDKAGNQAGANVATQGYSNTPPAITNITYSPKPIPAKGAEVTVTAKVTDPALGVSSVTLLESRPGYNNTYRSAPMSVGGDGVTYTATIPVDLNGNNGANGEGLTIFASDPANNQASAAVATQTYSNIPPVISQVKFSPDPIPVQGANITVTAKVTDPALGVSSVTLLESRPGYNNTYRSAPMSVGGDGVTYTATIPVDLNGNNGAGGESLVIVASDPANNQASYNVATQGYSSVPPSGSLPVLVTADASHPVLSPMAAAAGGAELPVNISGINFASGAVVLFNGVQLEPMSLTETLITVNVPASLLAQPGSYAVSVVDPSPSGASNSVNFNVTPSAVPGIASLTFNPSTVQGGSANPSGVVALTVKAPGALTVGLSSSNPAVLSVPSSGTIGAGGTEVTFTATSHAVTSSTSVTVSATYAGVVRTAVVTVTP